MYSRVHFLFEEERYLVILEKRKTYNLLITAYYLEYDNALEKQLKAAKELINDLKDTNHFKSF